MPGAAADLAVAAIAATSHEPSGAGACGRGPGVAMPAVRAANQAAQQVRVLGVLRRKTAIPCERVPGLLPRLRVHQRRRGPLDVAVPRREDALPLVHRVVQDRCQRADAPVPGTLADATILAAIALSFR